MQNPSNSPLNTPPISLPLSEVFELTYDSPDPKEGELYIGSVDKPDVPPTKEKAPK